MKSLYLISMFAFIMMFISDNHKQSTYQPIGYALHRPTDAPIIIPHTTQVITPIVIDKPKTETKPIKILVTSFGSYYEFNPNPSQELMDYVQTHYRKKNVQIVFQVLETSYEYCEQWINHIHLNNYDLIIHTGVDGMTEAFELEKFATKILNFPESDNDNNTSENRAVFETGDEFYATKINLDSVIKNMQSNQCVVVSEDAGGFLCNFIYYLTSYTAKRKHLPTDIIFVHVPPFENLDLEHQYPIFKNLLDVLIKYEYSKKQKHRK